MKIGAVLSLSHMVSWNILSRCGELLGIATAVLFKLAPLIAT